MDKHIQNYPRQSGRTTRDLMEMFLYALNNEGAKCVYVTHNQQFAHHCYDKLFRVACDLGVMSSRAKVPLMIWLVNKSVINFVSDAHPHDRVWLCGRDLDWVSYDHVI